MRLVLRGYGQGYVGMMASTQSCVLFQPQWSQTTFKPTYPDSLVAGSPRHTQSKTEALRPPPSPKTLQRKKWEARHFESTAIWWLRGCILEPFVNLLHLKPTSLSSSVKW